MKLKEYLVLFALAALWGGSFLFIKVAINDMSPLTLVAIRLVLGSLGLLVVVPFKPSILHGWSTRIHGYLLVAIFNGIIPYLAISWGEEHVTSGMAAILNATTPLAVVIVSNWWPGGERLTWQRIGGVLLGFLGVGVLVGPAIFEAGSSSLYVFGVCSVLVGAVSYAFGGLFASRWLKGLPLMQPAIGQLSFGALILAPIAGIALAVQPPAHAPGLPAIACALALALGGTSVAYLCYFWLIEHVGPTRTLIVTYLLPCFALVYGAIFLSEVVGLNAIAGLILVLAGIFITGKKPGQQRIAESVPQE
ncbi:MAG TPA: DMT family transporter [Ktedonobacteraceae bacterium]|jgi:drug/metabolite transporter (DMT)-like permease|nr:DMT family transporter [Ktedonobacteraceae bacterium]